MSLNKDENDDVEIISTHDEKIKLIGEILGNDSSRKILNLLNDDNEMTINEIAQSTELSLALVTHHIKRMQSAQLVKISRVGKSIKGHKMNYYAATNQSLLIVPSKNPVHSVKDSLKKFSKFVAIGMAGVVSWITLDLNNKGSMDLQVSEENFSDTVVTSTKDQSVDEWTSASELQIDSDVDVEYEDFSSEAELVANTQADEDLEVSHSGVEEFAYQLSDERANTGSVSLDETVYPVPFTGNSDPIESMITTIAIPILVVVSGIIIERVLSRWWNKRKQTINKAK
ncbi:MAG: winged helix-turn-helix transcriptional regulator [Nitrosopumilaceae archaeon]|nr:winged helix-turn-helix transcriptional regulator [Nitrosopumilaceae archaeon]